VEHHAAINPRTVAAADSPHGIGDGFARGMKNPALAFAPLLIYVAITSATNTAVAVIKSSPTHKAETVQEMCWRVNGQIKEKAERCVYNMTIAP
jgi:hypothetical protein